MGAGYSLGLLNQLAYNITKRKAMKIIKTFAQQGYVERFVEVIHGEVYFFDYEHPKIMTRCREAKERTLILDFYTQNKLGGSMPYSEISMIVESCNGDTLCDYTLKTEQEFSGYERKRIDFDTDRHRTICHMARSLYWLKQDIETQKATVESSENGYNPLCSFSEYLERVSTFYHKTGHLFLLCIGDW